MTATAPTLTTPTAPAGPAPNPGLATTLRLSWLLARRAGGERATIVLPVVAFGATTTLLLTVLAGAWSFRRWDDELAAMYQILAGIAVVLLVIPLLSLGGSAARLSARRRDDRLATLRLLGATPSAVVGMTVLESTALALLGALAGVVGYLVLGPAVAQIHFRGEAIGSAYWLPPLAVAAVVVAVALLAAASAATGLRRVVISPLGVRTRRDAPRMHPARVVLGVVLIGAAVLAVSGSYTSIVVAVLVVLGAFAVGLGVLNLVGPWVIGVLARRRHRRARTVADLIAARSIAEAPKAIWRQVGGVATTCFVAVVAGTGVAMMADAGEMTGPERFLPGDIRTGVLLTVVASFLLVACSTGVTQAAEVLDRRELYTRLDHLGVPPAVMQESRTKTVMVPLVTVAAGGALLGALLMLPLVGIALVMAPLSVVVIVGCLLLGLALVRVSLLATRPLLPE
ncbi:permease [Georgenia sp. TF02-10]|uniref:FtsX-like permease family protein n=1 Tax=Georgenia sp. TF02-10 TaxID=2917725 RepID=UPI001FA7A9F9|nr:FtsX-like permease family protein [Georgenia sp. TF02-10]UNX53264.1 permease [Georgenia sp. TF02-10]